MYLEEVLPVLTEATIPHLCEVELNGGTSHELHHVVVICHSPDICGHPPQRRGRLVFDYLVDLFRVLSVQLVNQID